MLEIRGLAVRNLALARAEGQLAWIFGRDKSREGARSVRLPRLWAQGAAGVCSSMPVDTKDVSRDASSRMATARM